MPLHSDDDNIIIERKKKQNKSSASSGNKKSGKSAGKKSSRKYDKHWKIISVLLIFISVFVFLALISYNTADEANASVSIGDLFSLLGGDEYMEARAATTNNWLGIVGAVLSYNLINGTFGYAVWILPVFMVLWSRYLFKGGSFPQKLLRDTSVYFLLSILFASFIGSMQNITWMFEIPKEWSGSIGIFLGTALTGVISPIGALIVFTAGIIFTLMLGTDIDFDPILEKFYNMIGKTSTKIGDAVKEQINIKRNDDDDDDDDESTSEKENTVNKYEPDLNPKPLAEDKIPNEAKTKKDVSPVTLSKRNFPDPVININKTAKEEEEEIFEINPNAEDEVVTSYDEEYHEDDTDQNIEPDLVDEKSSINDTSKDSIVDEPVYVDEEIIADKEQVTEDDDYNSPVQIQPHNREKTLRVIVEESDDEDIVDELDLEDSPLGTAIHDEEIKFNKPGFELLNQMKEDISVNDDELKMNAKILQEKLETFKIFIENLNVTPGPVVTQYEFVPAEGIKVSKIASLQDDLAMALKAKGIRIIAPIPGKGTVGVEIPNSNPAMVRFNDLVRSAKYLQTKALLPLALGKTINGDVYIADLAKMPHLLIAGSTGSGKSVGINTIICSLIYKLHPSELKFIIIDPKKVEMQQYSKLKEHYMATSPDVRDTIVTKPEDAVAILKSAVIEMEQRYDILAKVGQRNIVDYNEKVREGKFKNDPDMMHRPMPFIVVIVDELADLMLTASKEIEEPITRLAQMARAVGIHLVIATQRPSVDVITGLIKANFPARIAYMVASKIDSRTILDMQGAEHLLGMGDMLCLLSGEAKPVRVQNAFISTDEVEAICEFVGVQKGYSMPYQLPSIVEKNSEAAGISREDRDDLFEDAARLIIRHQQGSVSLLQRRLKIGYARAGRIVDELEDAGVVGPFDGSKARMVLMESESDLEAIL